MTPASPASGALLDEDALVEMQADAPPGDVVPVLARLLLQIEVNDGGDG
jgi:hypothetical protein